HDEVDVVDRDQAAEHLRDARGVQEHVLRRDVGGDLVDRRDLLVAHCRTSYIWDMSPTAALSSAPSISDSCSSSRLRPDGIRPSGRSTIITSRKNPKMPNEIDVTSKPSGSDRLFSCGRP